MRKTECDDEGVMIVNSHCGWRRLLKHLFGELEHRLPLTWKHTQDTHNIISKLRLETKPVREVWEVRGSIDFLLNYRWS